MNLLSMSLQAGVMICVVTVIRALSINRLPKKTVLALWGIVLLRLLIPFSLPSPFSVYSLANRTDLPLQIVPTPISNFPSPTTLPQNSVDIGKLEISLWVSIWGIGATLCALYFVIVYLRGRREFSVSQPVNNAFVSNWLKVHSLKRSIEIRQSSSISAPLTYGIFHPIIDIELSCDEAVVRSFGEAIKSDYALALIGMEEQKNTLTPFCNSFSKYAIEERIKSIMKYRKVTAITFSIAIILVAGVITGFATSAATNNEPPTTNTTFPKDISIPSVTSSQPPEQTANSLVNYEEYRTLGIDYNSESGRFYIDGELVKYFEDKALGRYFGAYEDGKYNVYALRNADGKLTGFDILNWTTNELDIKYREYTDFGLKFQKTDSNGLELNGKFISVFHDVAVGVGISRKNGGDGVEYQAVRDTLDPGPTGQGRLIDIKPKDEM